MRSKLVTASNVLGERILGGVNMPYRKVDGTVTREKMQRLAEYVRSGRLTVQLDSISEMGEEDVKLVCFIPMWHMRANL